MHSDLIMPEEEKALFNQLVEYYKKLYPGIGFKKVEILLKPEEIAGIIYTYPGEETEATFREEVQIIADSLKNGYDTPVIILRKLKDRKDILLDGHRRLKVAFDKKIGWKALAMVPDREVQFGIEKMGKGKIADIFKKT
ncbi:MAG: hypothetical protein PHO02_04695 [Candidatus Nanoarchaeia archaeon]|nr:hypothetical protein [Candidatus Nanoarchaeia archaeon]